MSSQRKRKAKPEPKRFSVVLVDFVGYESWVESFDTETELREYLLKTCECHDNADEFSNMSLEDLAEEARKSSMMGSESGACPQIVAVVKDGDFLLYAHSRI